jgi:hypothetical protein
MSSAEVLVRGSIVGCIAGALALACGSSEAEAPSCPEARLADGHGLDAGALSPDVPSPGCDRFPGEPLVTESVVTPGGTLVVTSVKGALRIVEGTGSSVRTRIEPFILLPRDASEASVRAELAKLQTQTSPGQVTGMYVQTSRGEGALATLGADITIEVPHGFDGSLSLSQVDGPTEVAIGGPISRISMNAANGPCDVVVGARAEEINLTCRDGDLTAIFEGVAPGAWSSTLGALNGSATVDFTAARGSTFAVQSQVTEGAVEAVESAPEAGCSPPFGAGALTRYSCNGAGSLDPIYTVTSSGLGSRLRLLL